MLGVINFTKNVFFPTKFGVEGRLQSSNSYHMSCFNTNLWRGCAPPQKKKNGAGLRCPPFPPLKREGGNILIVENNAKFKNLKKYFFQNSTRYNIPPLWTPSPIPYLWGIIHSWGRGGGCKKCMKSHHHCLLVLGRT